MTDEQIQFKLSENRKGQPKRVLPMAQTMLRVIQTPLCFALGIQKECISQISLRSVAGVAIRM